jgi:hypothetical protein
MSRTERHKRGAQRHRHQGEHREPGASQPSVHQARNILAALGIATLEELTDDPPITASPQPEIDGSPTPWVHVTSARELTDSFFCGSSPLPNCPAGGWLRWGWRLGPATPSRGLVVRPPPCCDDGAGSRANVWIFANASSWRGLDLRTEQRSPEQSLPDPSSSPPTNDGQKATMSLLKGPPSLAEGAGLNVLICRTSRGCEVSD